MTHIITYSLKADTANSDGYYQTVSAFVDSWLAQTIPEVQDLVSGFRKNQQSIDGTNRSDPEYAFELLALGVLLREHGKEASSMPGWVEHPSHWLVEIQNQHPNAAKLIKASRGWLGWIAGQIPGRNNSKDVIDDLLTCLRANDETAKEIRIKSWHEYFKAKGDSFLQIAISRCTDLADEFSRASLEALGKYTENVEQFLAEEVPKHRRRYDARLLSCTRLEYHLGMLGTEILNHAYRQRFLSTSRKMVILPPCMCAPAEKCKAIETPIGAKCQACTPTCRVNQITKLGEKRGFSVTMIPDDVKVFGSGKDVESIGLVGVSCALTNWNGGWETGALGIPAQGLLLDYVGCKIHWDKDGIPTDANLKKLQEILGI